MFPLKLFLFALNVKLESDEFGGMECNKEDKLLINKSFEFSVGEILTLIVFDSLL